MSRVIAGVSLARGTATGDSPCVLTPRSGVRTWTVPNAALRTTGFTSDGALGARGPHHSVCRGTVIVCTARMTRAISSIR